MSRHVVLGAGPVGRAIVQSLVERGIDVDVVSRSGTQVARARAVVGDVRDVEGLKKIAGGADVVYQASQPEYTRWPQEFPSLQDGVAQALRGTDTVLVAVENLYGYGIVNGPISETHPLVATGRKGKVRADMWRSLFAEYEVGNLKVTAGRGSDFFGPYAEGSAVGDRYFPRLLNGKKAEVMGDPDALHSYTFVGDFGEALVRLALDSRSLGHAWHVPNAPAISQRAFLERAALIAGVQPKLTHVTRVQLKIAGLFIPPAREIPEMLYEFEHDFVVDHSAYAHLFGDHATPLDESLAVTLDWWKQHAK